ncbi:hypothetical protein, partial [Streptomyces tendae]
PPMRSFLGVPIRVQGEIFGNPAAASSATAPTVRLRLRRAAFADGDVDVDGDGVDPVMGYLSRSRRRR